MQTDTDETLARFLQLGRAIKTRLERVVPLPFAQCEILAYVREHDSPSMQQLAKRFNITAPSATSLVEGLVRGKCLRRERDRTDRRSIRVVLTPAGKRTATLLARRRKEVIGKMIAGLSPADRRELSRILDAIIKTL